jgi:hypothetical protein
MTGPWQWAGWLRTVPHRPWRRRALFSGMDTPWSFGTRSVPRASLVAKVLGGLIAAAALAGIYPIAATIATAMATTLKMDKADPAAPIVVSVADAERNSLGLRRLASTPPPEARKP